MEQEAAPRKFISRVRAAEILNCHVRTIDRWREAQIILPFYELPAGLRYDEAEVRAVAESYRREVVGNPTATPDEEAAA